MLSKNALLLSLAKIAVAWPERSEFVFSEIIFENINTEEFKALIFHYPQSEKKHGSEKFNRLLKKDIKTLLNKLIELEK